MPSGLTKLRIPQTSAAIACPFSASARYVPSVTDTRGVYAAGRETLRVDAAVDLFLRPSPRGQGSRRGYRVDVEEFASWLRRRGQKVEDVVARVLAEYTS